MNKHQELRSFAAMAMASVLSNDGETKRIIQQCLKDNTAPSKIIADASILFAQALQKALDAVEPKPCEHKNVNKEWIEDWPPYGGGGSGNYENFCADCGAKL